MSEFKTGPFRWPSVPDLDQESAKLLTEVFLDAKVKVEVDDKGTTMKIGRTNHNNNLKIAMAISEKTNKWTQSGRTDTQLIGLIEYLMGSPPESDKNTLTFSEAVVENHINEIKSYEFDFLFRWFRWKSENGIGWYIRKNPNVEEWIRCEVADDSDILRFAHSEIIDENSKKHLFEIIENDFKRETGKVTDMKTPSIGKKFIFDKEALKQGSRIVVEIEYLNLLQWFNEDILKAMSLDSRFCLPKMEVVSNDEKTPCFCYVPLDFKKGPHPTWDQWLLQMPEWARPVFRAWIFSVCKADNGGRQSLMFRDSGYTGKSAVGRVLNRYFGKNFTCALSKDSLSNQFWGSKIYGRRLLIMNDSGNSKIYMMDKVKQLTGGDSIDVEYKGKKSFTWTADVKILVTTNRFPEIHIHEVNQTTRIIYIPLKQHTDPKILKEFCATDENGNIVYDIFGQPKRTGGRNFENNLFKEMKYFLGTCAEDYKRLCPTDNDIILPDAAYKLVQEHCATEESDNLTRLREDFVELTKNPDHKILNSEIKLIMAYYKDHLQLDLRMERVGHFLVDAGAEKTTFPARKEDGTKTTKRGYSGVRLRQEWKLDETEGLIKNRNSVETGKEYEIE